MSQQHARGQLLRSPDGPSPSTGGVSAAPAAPVPAAANMATGPNVAMLVTPAPASLIRPSASSLGGVAKPVAVVIKEVPAEPPPPKIMAFEQKLGRKHEDSWSRSPNVTGTGAIHVKSFHCKLNDEALGYIDQQVNEWLDAHPQYDVKLVTTSTGEWAGKLGKETHLIMQVWV